MWRRTDVEIPRAVWSSWIPNDGLRSIIRPLGKDERAELEKRVYELEPALAPYFSPDEVDDVMLAVADMFSGFETATKVSAESGMAKIESVSRMLQPYPMWAIRAACERVRVDGYEVKDRDGTRREKHWPPADAEIVAEVKKEVRLRADALASARALLAAPVETR